MTMAEDESDQFVVAVVAIIKKANQLLIMKRSSHRLAAPNIWETVSGRVQHGEDPYDAVQREILEETGLEVSVDSRPVDVYMAKRLGLPMLLVVYQAKYLSKEVVLSEEHSEFMWTTIEDFEEKTPLKKLTKAARKAFELETEIRS